RSRSAARRSLAGVAGIADVAVERLDVVAVRVEQIRGVVAGRVVAEPGSTVRYEAGIDTRAVEGVDGIPRARVKAEVQPPRRRRPCDDVDVREGGLAVTLVELRDPERREHRLVEDDAAREVARVQVDVFADRPRPAPPVRHHSPWFR